jgi:hypothetical protein
VQTVHSSLFVQADWSLENMANNTHYKSEPPASQHAEVARSPVKRAHSDETERPPSAQQLHHDTDENDHEHVKDEEGDVMDADPAAQIVEFDWDALHQRYYEAMATCHDEEGTLAQEFESLMAVLLPSYPT